jgi:hypothetical protein
MTRSTTTLSRALFVAASLALAGAAQAAQTWDSPQAAGEASTMTNGQPNVSTDNPNGPMYVYTLPVVPSTTVMGSGPAVVYTYGYVYPAHVISPERRGASETSNVPLRAGEMSAMTNGAPNVETLN